MTRFEVTDESLIAADPGQVMAAIDDEGAQRSTWWAPYLLLRVGGGVPATAVGAIWDMTWNAGAGTRGSRTLWTRARMERSSAAGLLLRYVDGPLDGVLEFGVERAFDGHSLVRSRLRADPRGRLRLTAAFRDIPAEQHHIMRRGFAGLADHVVLHRTSSAV